VALLDKKVPNWRQTMRKHVDQYNFSDGACCVLGTLEHYNGRMRTLRAKGVSAADIKQTLADEGRFETAKLRLGQIEGAEYGFDTCFGDHDRADTDDDPMVTLHELWKTEFEKAEV
jgi:hypothetical protein